MTKKMTATTTARRPAGMPVKPGEDAWKKAEINAVREDLVDERLRLTEELDEMATELADMFSEGIDEAGDDSADSGNKTYERDHEIALVNSMRGMRDQVDAAIQRLDSGEFGTCKSCEQPIGKLRLIAFPQADLCLECKQRQERR